MYKKLVTFLVFSLYAPLAAFSADDPSRARLYIPVSTDATVEGCATCEIKASGYALDYVFGFGLGLGVASSKTTVTGNPNFGDYSFDTGQMINIGYTFGSDFSFTIGYGMGSSPKSDLKIPLSEGQTKYEIIGKRSTNTFLGLGYNMGSIEILFGMRNIATMFYQEMTMAGGAIYSYVADVDWRTTDIGVGFTF